MKVRHVVRAAAFAVSATAAFWACAQARQPAQSVASSLPKQPREAAPALKATVGKPFSAGYVFIDGRYIKPPYRVERYGTVIRVNGIQVTNQIIPWEEFVKTQSGVKVTKTEIAAPEAAPEPEPAEDVSLDSLSFDPDDLFADDDPKPKATKPRRTPRPRKPTTMVTYAMEGPFVPNERTKEMVDSINGYRTKIDGQLRTGWYFFFGSRYATVSGDARIAPMVMDQICRAMRECATLEQFSAALKRAETSVLPQPLVEDLFNNRIGRPALERRVREVNEQREFQDMIKRAR